MTVPLHTHDKFQFRLPREERAAYGRAAERCGLSLSVWIRQILRHAAGLPTLGVPR